MVTSWNPSYLQTHFTVVTFPWFSLPVMMSELKFIVEVLSLMIIYLLWSWTSIFYSWKEFDL